LEEARQLLSEAITHQQAALKINPRNPTYRQFLRSHYWNLAETLVRWGDHGEAAQAAAKLPELYPAGWLEYHRAAGFLARCVPLAEKDAKLTEEKRKELARTYGLRAVELLSEAISKGYKNAKKLKDDAHFDSLRMRDDFKRLLSALEAKVK
jgi:hypothetical protein